MAKSKRPGESPNRRSGSSKPGGNTIPAEWIGTIEAAARITAVLCWRNYDEPAPDERGDIPAKVAEYAQSALGFESCRKDDDSGWTVRAIAGFKPADLAGPVGCLPTALVYHLALGRLATAIAKSPPDLILEICTRSWMFAGDEMSRPIPGTRRDFVGGPYLSQLIDSSNRRQANG